LVKAGEFVQNDFRPATEQLSTCESQPDEVQFDLRVAVFGSPEIQRRGGDFINQWLSFAESCQVDAFDVVFARLTRFDSDVIVRG